MAEQLIYLEVNDGIAEAVTRLQRAKGDEVILVVPQRALLLQGVVNLKILKRQADLMGKTVSLVTRDEVGRNFAGQAGFKVLEKLGDEASEISGEVMDASPAEVPDISEPTPPSKKSKIKYKQYEPSSPTSKPKIVVQQGEDEVPVEASKDKAPAIRPVRSTRLQLKLERHHQVFIGFVVIGLIILGSVGFFILPRADVSLEVQSEAFNQQFTLMLTDEQDLKAAGSNILAGRFVEVTRESVSSFEASGEENKGEKSEGKITIVNHTSIIQGLVVNTRFQSSNGLVFRVKNEILVPPARSGTPGRATVAAISDGGGTQYNVAAPMRLTIPGLGESAVSSVYGEVSGSFAGGTDDITRIVSEEDIEQAKEESSKNVFVAAESELQEELKRGEELLPELVQNDIIDAVPSVSAGAKKDKFEMRVQSRSWVVLVDQDDLSEAIANAAAFEVVEGKQVTQNTIENAQIEVVESNFLSHQVKLVVTLDGRVGPQLNQPEIISSLANKPIVEGEELLRDLPEVTSATIEIWPTFMTRIPMLQNNIRLHTIYLGE